MPRDRSKERLENLSPERAARKQQYMREYNHRNNRLPEVIARKKITGTAGHLRRKFGITTEQRDEMLLDQLGGCAICGAHIEFGHKRRLKHGAHIDHCHETGRVRGILCGGCNTALGKFGDSIDTLTKALDYLRSKEG